jgi:hypothetical protein
MRNSYTFGWKTCHEKRPLWRPEHRWQDNIKMDLKEMELEGLDSLAEERI